ncbi:hypothetical protein BpHYR1_034561 [Brachionus plicatilis]|uniref:Uncharacterized protein n=1 Tax=Brachionus plicatilis TaxID=10195 RepID=A0A3M7R177_BRAPC|nr:hypothetical protein BpHYR1_034561 [Brachionus plicatilis]
MVIIKDFSFDEKKISKKTKFLKQQSKEVPTRPEKTPPVIIISYLLMLIMGTSIMIRLGMKKKTYAPSDKKNKIK